MHSRDFSQRNSPAIQIFGSRKPWKPQWPFSTALCIRQHTRCRPQSSRGDRSERSPRGPLALSKATLRLKSAANERLLYDGSHNGGHIENDLSFRSNPGTVKCLWRLRLLAVQLTTSDLFVFVVRRHVRMSCSRNPDREEYHWDRKE